MTIITDRAALVAQYQQARTLAGDEWASAFARVPSDMTAIVQTLALYDDGLFDAAKTVESIRRHLRLSTPVIPHAKEAARLGKQLFQVQPRETASDLATGG